MNLPLRTSPHCLIRQPMSMVGNCLKGRSGGGMASIAEQLGKARCTMDPHSQMSSPPNEETFIEIFIHLFPIGFLEEMIINATSNVLLMKNAMHVTFGELLWYIGMMLLTLCYIISPDYFWHTTPRMGRMRKTTLCHLPLTNTCHDSGIWPSRWHCSL